MKAVKTVVFALASGLFWSPIITATEAYLGQYSANQEVGKVKQANAVIQEAVMQPTPGAQTKVVDAANQISDALAKIPNMSSPDSKKEIIDTSKLAVASISARTATPESVQGLKNIGLASTKADLPQVRSITLDQLHRIAEISQSPITKSAAISATEQINNSGHAPI